MMQEYVLPATPAKARRLLELAEVRSVEITEEVRTLAGEGLIDFTPHPDLNELQQTALQRLIDYELRGVLLCDNEGEARRVLFLAAEIMKVKPIVVCTSYPRLWKVEAEALGLTVDVQPRERPDVLLVERTNLLRQDVVEPRRDGLLILEQQDRSNDYVHGGYGASGPAREFARTVVLANFRPMTRIFHSWTRQCDISLQSLLEDLWPASALNILNQNLNRTSHLREHGFTKMRPAELYPLFNVVTDLLGSKAPR